MMDTANLHRVAGTILHGVSTIAAGGVLTPLTRVRRSDGVRRTLITFSILFRDELN